MSKATTAKKSGTPKPRFIPTNEEAKAKFKSIVKPKEGANDYVDLFLALMDSVIAEKQSFTVSELVKLSVPYGLPTDVVSSLADRWIHVMSGLNKVTLVNGCYDEPIACCV